MDVERARRTAQVLLVVVGVASGGGAAWRYAATRDGGGPPAPVRSAVVQPSSGPVGSRPFVELIGWPRGQTVRVLFCAPRSGPQHCAELASGRFPATLHARPIPPALPAAAGGREPVRPGVAYDVRAGLASDPAPEVVAAFRVVPFSIGPVPRTRSYSSADVTAIELGPPRQIARGVPCVAAFTPDDRLVVQRAVFDPRTAVTVELAVQGAELAWSPRRDRLAIVTDDRKEIRMAEADGRGAEVVVREARGLINSVTWSPQGDKVAYVARPEPGVRGGPGRPTVFALDLTGGERTPLGPGEAVAWSPAGGRLAVEVSQGAARAIELSDESGKRTRLTEGRAPAWSQDGALLTFVKPVQGEVGSAWVTKVDGATPRLLVPQDVCAAAFSRDGTRLAVVTRSGPASALFLRSVSVPAPRTSPRP